MRFSYWLTAVFTMILCAASFTYLFWYKPKFSAEKAAVLHAKRIEEPGAVSKLLFEKLSRKSAQAKDFVHGKHYNQKICFLIDMSIASGKPRFFVYNLPKDSVELAGLVTHGQGSDGIAEIEYSNEPGSYCTSRGRYKIGSSYHGRFGLAFKLHGLDKTNNRAYERAVVLHAHECVPDEPVYPLRICESQGCPTVSPAFLQKLKKYVESEEKPVLLIIFN